MSNPDILLLVLDTQRADRLGCYRNPSFISPNLDEFSSEAALFEHAISPAQWTIPSHASMFTGLYSTAHQVTQYRQTLSPDLPHLAELLNAAGYETVGLSNNALIGIFNNGLTRGFEGFYNYGGAAPKLLKGSLRPSSGLSAIVSACTRFLRRIAYPIQSFLGQSELAFHIPLSTWSTPLWARMANTKGQNERSVHDACRFLRQRERRKKRRPLFMFLNLMETHMPLWPPEKFLDKIAPGLGARRDAQELMRAWNREAHRWEAPLDKPLDGLEYQVLSDMYDAEVTYQDDYLGRLFSMLGERGNRDNTLTIITADHGQGLGEHNYFGHSFVAYQELMHVPLIVHWPIEIEPERVSSPVSTRRIFHTILNAAAPSPLRPGIRQLALQQTLNGPDPEQNTACAEVYPALHSVKVLERRQPELIPSLRSLALRRAIVKDDLKLIQVDGAPDELFDLGADPHELTDILAQQPAAAAQLNRQLERVMSRANQKRAEVSPGTELDIEGDERLLQRLRDLGYIE